MQVLIQAFEKLVLVVPKLATKLIDLVLNSKLTFLVAIAEIITWVHFGNLIHVTFGNWCRLAFASI